MQLTKYPWHTNNYLPPKEERPNKTRTNAKLILHQRIQSLRDLVRAQMCLLEEGRSRYAGDSEENDEQEFIENCNKLLEDYKIKQVFPLFLWYTIIF
jgi:hypothetical protein